MRKAGKPLAQRPREAVRSTDQHLRLALHLLKTQYELSGDNEVRVFSRVFDTTIMTKGKMTSQYFEHERAKKSHLWQFCTDSSAEARKCRQLMQERLSRAITELGIEEPGDLPLDRLTLSTPSKKQKPSRTTPSRHRSYRDLGDDDYEPPSKRTRLESNGGATEDSEDISADQSAPTNGEDVDIATPERPKTPKTLRQETATHLYNRPVGPLMLTPEEFRKTKEPLHWPATEVPLPVLAFR